MENGQKLNSSIIVEKEKKWNEKEMSNIWAEVSAQKSLISPLIDEEARV